MIDTEGIWVADFETTTEQDYREDGYVRVYLWHARHLPDDRTASGTDIASFIDFASKRNVRMVWFHNLKFDGSFILNHILDSSWEWAEKQDRTKPTYDHIVTDTGQWMELTLRFGRHVCTFRDSAKKFPGFSLEEVARTYGIKGKTSLDTHIRRGPDHVVTPEEVERVENDTRILRTAMCDLYARGMTAMTMASDAKRCYRRMWDESFSSEVVATHKWKRTFPELSLDDDRFIRAAYKGGWVYVNPAHRGRDVRMVHTYDVNSMFPDKMRNKPLPVGRPVRREPKEGELYIVHFDAMFSIKPGRFPTVQTKNSFRHMEAEYITESEGYMHLAMTNIDYELFHEQYDVISEQNHEYMVFSSQEHLFDTYVDHWMAEKVRCKEEGDPAGEATAKRYLNSLYGKTAESPTKMSKMSTLSSGVIKWETVTTEGSTWYPPIGVFITAYARDQIVRSAQVFGDDFIYADTDSIHCINAKVHEAELDVHYSRLGAWKWESVSYKGRYIRPKTYAHLTQCNMKQDSEGRWYCKSVDGFEVKAAGMTDACKSNLTWDNFHAGVEVEGKLAGRQVPGGYCLAETTYRIKVTT